jgi:predicted amidohydrolase
VLEGESTGTIPAGVIMTKRKIAICQFGLRDQNSYDDMGSHLIAQCKAAQRYEPDMILFPELTTLGLLAMAGPTLNYADLGNAFRDRVAPFTPTYEKVFSQQAAESGSIIIGGSHWTIDASDGRAYNIASIFYPDGRIDRQKKNHLFPGENDWGTATYDGMQVFDAGWVKFGVMTCYDSEFPEVGRHLMINGAQILFCPSATYTERGYYRIRNCCRARAVENQVFVVEGHQVGALSVPSDRPFTGYGKSAVFCPIDDQTGVTDGTIIEAPNGDQEQIVVGEIDLEILSRSRNASEATILNDRRPSSYKEHYNLY